MKTSQLREAIRTIVKSKLNKINESEGNSETIMLDDLTVDNIKNIFPKFGEEYGSLNFPNPDDSLTQVNSERSLEQWKDETRERYGNVEVTFYPEETIWFNKVKINDPKFMSDKETYVKRKERYIDAERASGKYDYMDEGKENSDYITAMDIWKRVKNHPTMGSEEREQYKQKLLQAAKKAGIKLDLN